MHEPGQHVETTSVQPQRVRWGGSGETVGKLGVHRRGRDYRREQSDKGEGAQCTQSDYRLPVPGYQTARGPPAGDRPLTRR